MGLFDGLLSQVSEHVDIKNMAEKVGLSPEQAEQAVAALAHAHPQPGDTVSQAAQTTGLSADTLQQVVSHIGGEGALGQFSELLGKQGGIMGQLGGMFGKS